MYERKVLHPIPYFFRVVPSLHIHFPLFGECGVKHRVTSRSFGNGILKLLMKFDYESRNMFYNVPFHVFEWTRQIFRTDEKKELSVSSMPLPSGRSVILWACIINEDSNWVNYLPIDLHNFSQWVSIFSITDRKHLILQSQFSSHLILIVIA